MNTANNPHAVIATRFADPTQGIIRQREVECLLAGLERQKEELGPIADELIDLFRHLGVAQPPRSIHFSPSNE